MAKDEELKPEKVAEKPAEPKPKPEVKPKPKPVYKVVKLFRDKDNFNKQYKVGDDVSHLHKSRLENLINLKLVEVK